MPVHIGQRQVKLGGVADCNERFGSVEPQFLSKCIMPIVRGHYNGFGTTRTPAFQGGPYRLAPATRKLFVQQYERASRCCGDDSPDITADLPNTKDTCICYVSSEPSGQL